MRIAILTIFPEIFEGFLESSLIKKSLDKKLFEIILVNIRDFASPPHYQVDDIPYGGGAGMVMTPEPLLLAINHAKSQLPSAPVILLTPAGKVFKQSDAYAYSKGDLILVCGRYEGVDQRLIDLAIDHEVSLGDFVIMGGEVAAMAIIEATSRLIPGVLGNSDSLDTESFHQTGDPKLLEAPQYTRPQEFEGLSVPEVLISGNHKKIAEWRKTMSVELTQNRRPELLKSEK